MTSTPPRKLSSSTTTTTINGNGNHIYKKSKSNKIIDKINALPPNAPYYSFEVSL